MNANVATNLLNVWKDKDSLHVDKMNKTYWKMKLYQCWFQLFSCLNIPKDELVSFIFNCELVTTDMDEVTRKTES